MQSLHEPNRNFKQLLSLVLVLAFWSNVVCAAGGPAPAGAARRKPDAAGKSSGVVDLLRERLKTERPAPAPAEKPAGVSARVAETFGKLPLRFEVNRGQTDPSVKFLARGKGYGLFLTGTEAVMVFGGRDAGAKESVVRMKLKGGNPRPAVEGLEELSGRSNYLIGSDPGRWQIGVESFEKVRYAEVYAGVDAVYYGNHGRLEHDFVVAPGADPRVIKLEYDGANSLRVDRDGDLVMKVRGGEVRQTRPVAYQMIEGRRREVTARYVLKGRQVAFSVGEYDRAHALVIDPILVFSSYLGGNGNDAANAVTLDAAGNIYLTGSTASTNFPTLNPRQATNLGASDVFVTKLNPSGSAILYSTYLGGTVRSRVEGSGSDSGTSIAVDASGNAYVAGSTSSNDFPTAGTLDATYGGDPFDGFVFKLNPTGATLLYSAYLGGSLEDMAHGIALDSAGNAYVTGYTASTNFPVVTPFQAANAGGAFDAFVTKVNAAGSAFVYSTYLGGNSGDQGNAIAVDAAGNAYVTGSTPSTNFPTANAFQPFNSGPEEFGQSTDAFVTKLNPAGTGLVFSTYLGGNQPYPSNFGGFNLNFATDDGAGIAVDSAGNVYVAGRTGAMDFPTANAFQSSLAGTGGSNAFVTKFTPPGTGLVYSTYLGGNSSSYANGIAVDAGGRAHVAGYTLASNFPTANAIQPQLRTSTSGGVDAFITKFTAAGSSLAYSTYLGGGEQDYANAVVLDPNGNAYVAGYTYSTDFPTAGPQQPANAGGQDAFILKIADAVGHTIRGRVTTADGAPLNGVPVTLSGSMSATAITSGNGNYTFANLAGAGNYTVAPSLPPYTFAPASRTFNNLNADQTADFAIETYNINGRVTDAGGNGVGGVKITIGGTHTATGTTGADGRYSFINFAQGGNYTVTPSKTDILLTYSFSPPSYSYTNLSASQVADFVATTSVVNALYPVADAYVQDGAAASTNFGAATSLGVRTDATANSGNNRDAYFRFDLTGLGKNVTNARLRVYAALSAAGSVATSAYSVADTAWSEFGINWNNKPARSASPLAGAGATVNSTTHASYDIDVTAYVKAEKAAGRDVVSLALHDPAATTLVINLNSREAEQNRPQLFVTTAAGGNAGPGVQLTAPANGATFTEPASITLSATANDGDGSVSKVDFYAGTARIGTAAAAPYQMTWANVVAGSYSLRAVATDNLGGTTESGAVSISVLPPNVPPAVSITSPQGGATFAVGSDISLTARATDADQGIEKVEFFDGPNLIGAATPTADGDEYVVTWTGAPVGVRTVTARATDKAGAAQTSPPLTLNFVGQTALSATADAYVRDGASDRLKLGTEPELQAQQSTTVGENRETFLKFDLTNVTSLTRARLRLYGRLSAAGEVPVSVYAVSDTGWPETRLQWIKKPVSDATPLSTVSLADNVERWHEWDVTPYVLAEKAAGRDVVSFAVKGAANASAYATFNSREATGHYPQLTLWTAMPRQALLVHGGRNPTAAETAIQTRLQNLGFSVTLKVANAKLTAADAEGKALVVVSSTVLAADVGTTFRNSPVPVVTWDAELFDRLGMTAAVAGTDFGTTAGQTQVDVVGTGHPMSAGLFGPVTVTSAAGDFSWGAPSAAAVKVATLAGAANRFAVFGYEGGAQMVGLDAPARRVGLFLTDATGSALTPSGGALFDAAVRWAAGLVTSPIVSGLSPSAGLAGTTVQITGDNFGATQGASTVTFNGARASVSSWGEKLVVVTVPAYATTGPVVVTVGGVPSNGLIFAVGETDSDGDGLPDNWEQSHFGNLGQTAAGDPDGDGLTNLQEYQQGRNPTKSALADSGDFVGLKVHTPLRP